MAAQMDAILGQDRAIEVLQTQLAAGRPHHAYIFGGPAGVGKFTTAVALARLLLCHRPGRDDAGRRAACGECESCRLLPAPSPDADAAGASVMAGQHPDLHVVVKELAAYSDDATVRSRKLTQIPTEVLREHLIEPVYRAARLEHGKVFILDEAELLNAPGQNLLLKTLEEPPAGTTIILVTASEDRLLPTIRSRCHRIAFVPLSDEVVRRYVQDHLPRWTAEADTAVADAEQALADADRRTRKRCEEQLEAARAHREWIGRLNEKKVLDWLVRFADGSLGRAALAVEHDLAEWASVVLPALRDLASGRPHAELGEQIADRIDAFARGWVERHANASKEAANKLAADLMGALITVEARRRLSEIAAECPVGDALTNEPRFEPWLGVIDAVQHMRELLASNVHLGLTCDDLVASMTHRLAVP